MSQPVFEVRPFDPLDDDDAAAWDRWCSAAPNASFLHTRRFLSYHGPRFVDRSLVLSDRGRWLGVLPAAEAIDRPRTLESHPGITYGGLLHHGALRGQAMLQALQAVVAYAATAGFDELRYKAVPAIYQAAPAQDDLYALWRLGAVRTRCDLGCAIDLHAPWIVSERRRRGLAKARRAGLVDREGPMLAGPVWSLVDETLRRRHDAAPVHSLAELTLLAERFPAQIAFAAACNDDGPQAAVILFRGPRVWRAQYIASSESGFAMSALDGLFDTLITQARSAGARYFDFGTSNTEQGRVLNDGLYRFKSEFGGGGVACETYTLRLAPEQA